MTFTLRVATDLFAEKTNFELDFATVPSLPELRLRAESIFQREQDVRKPQDYTGEPFRTDHMQVFDAGQTQWVELSSSTQLTNGCQIYFFQPVNRWHNDAQGGLPSAVKPPVLGGGAPPSSIARLSPPGLTSSIPPPPPVVPPPPAVLDHLDAIDTQQKEAITRAGLLLGELVETTHAARQATSQAEAEVHQHRLKVDMQSEAEARSLANVAATSATLDQAKQQAENAREELVTVQGEMERLKEEQRVTSLEHVKAIEAVGAAESRHAAQDAETARAERRLAEISRLVQEQRNVVERHRGLVARSRADVETAQTRSEHATTALDVAKKATEDSQEALRQAKDEHASSLERTRVADGNLDAAREESQRAKETVEQKAGLLASAKDQERLKRQEQVEAQRVVVLNAARAMSQGEQAAKAELHLKEVKAAQSMQQLEVDRQTDLLKRCNEDLEQAKKPGSEGGGGGAGVPAGCAPCGGRGGHGGAGA